MNVRTKRTLALLVVCLLGLAACQTDSPMPAAVSDLDQSPVDESGLVLAKGYAANVIATGLAGPTQMINGPDGRLWVAQLNGGENAGTGQIVAVDLQRGTQEVLLDRLTKPTGLAVVDGALWVVSGADILRAPLSEDNRPEAAESVLSDLPNNGRSNGTLTVTPDGQLLYETSGRRQGSAAVAGSGMLWLMDPAQPEAAVPLASGLKGAYAHTVDAAGRLWTSEIGDDPVNGQAPPDEINLIVAGADYGWPSCYGWGEPALNYGGTEERCATTARPAALLPQRSTPTAIIESPWEPGVLLVALWLSGEVVRVNPAEATDTVPAPITTIVDGLQQPQHLLQTADGQLLLSDHATGTIFEVTKQN